MASILLPGIDGAARDQPMYDLGHRYLRFGSCLLMSTGGDRGTRRQGSQGVAKLHSVDRLGKHRLPIEVLPRLGDV
jgi:hypothetical protein